MKTNARSITVFRSRLDPEMRDEYGAMASHVVALAVAMPGYVSHKTFVAEDGERVTIAEFTDEVHEQAWANHPEHAKAMEAGRSRFFTDYNIKVCTVDRELVPGPGSRAAAEAEARGEAID